MPIRDDEVKKVLVIDLGQVGDVIMSFPALIALQNRFPSAELVAVAGKTPAKLIGDLGLVDRVLAIDRYGLLRGPKFKAISRIFSIVRRVRKEKFDLVVDLHSLYESNLLGYLSGAKHRLFANRRNRSLDFLSNIRPGPPLYDPGKHLAQIYLDVLQPLGIAGVSREVKISTPADLVETFRAEHIEPNNGPRKLIGLPIGAGNPSRKWPLRNFIDLARRLCEAGNCKLFVFLGPEEKPDESSIRERFGDLAVIVPDLSLIELAAAFSTLDIVIGNDTGTTHLAAVSGPAVIMISDIRAPETFSPLGESSKTVKTDVIEKITVDDVWTAIGLSQERAHEEKQPEKDEPDQR